MKVACTVLEGESGGNPADLLRKIEITVLILKRIKIMTTIFTLAFAAVMFSGMVFCMGMFLKHVVSSIPEVTNINHRFCLSK